MNMPTKTTLALLDNSKFSKVEHIYQLQGLVNDFGYLGAIEYLKPLKWNNPNRDQILANIHKDILINLKAINETI